MDYDPLHASLLDAVGKNDALPSTMLDRYRKEELEGIAGAWLSLVKSRLSQCEYVLSQDLRRNDLIAIIRRLESANRKL